MQPSEQILLLLLAKLYRTMTTNQLERNEPRTDALMTKGCSDERRNAVDSS